MARLFVKNIGGMTELELRDLFSPHGCTAATVMRDRYTHEPRGFWFVTIEDPDGAIANLDGKKEIDGRRLRVEIARPPRTRDYRADGSKLNP